MIRLARFVVAQLFTTVAGFSQIWRPMVAEAEAKFLPVAGRLKTRVRRRRASWSMGSRGRWNPSLNFMST